MMIRWLIAFILCMIIYEYSLHFNDTWKEKVLEYEDKVREYDQHNCVNVKTTNTLIKEECNRLSIIINTSPFIRTITKTVYSWYTISFREFIYKIVTTDENKIPFLIVSLGIIYHIVVFSMISLDKFIEIKDRERARLTDEYIKQKLSNELKYPISYSV
jgi:hypothetical protein